MKSIKDIKKAYSENIQAYISLERMHDIDTAEHFYIRAITLAEVLERDIIKDIRHLEQKF